MATLTLDRAKEMRRNNDFRDRSRTVRMCTAETLAEQITCCGFEFPEHDCTVDRCDHALACWKKRDHVAEECEMCSYDDIYCSHRVNDGECDSDDLQEVTR